MRTPLSDQLTLDAKIEPYTGPPLTIVPVEPPTLYRVGICVLLGMVAFYASTASFYVVQRSLGTWLGFGVIFAITIAAALVASEMKSRRWRRPTWWVLGAICIPIAALVIYTVSGQPMDMGSLVLIGLIAPMSVAGFAGAIFDRHPWGHSED